MHGWHKKGTKAYQYCIEHNLKSVLSSLTIERLKKAGDCFSYKYCKLFRYMKIYKLVERTIIKTPDDTYNLYFYRRNIAFVKLVLKDLQGKDIYNYLLKKKWKGNK